VGPVVRLELWIQFWTRIVDPTVRPELWIQLLKYNCRFNRIIVGEMAPDACYITELEFCFKLLHLFTRNSTNRSTTLCADLFYDTEPKSDNKCRKYVWQFMYVPIQSTTFNASFFQESDSDQ
jgi:hypothetical protein